MHRCCAKLGGMRSRSLWLRLIGPAGPGSPKLYSSRQPLPLANPFEEGPYFSETGHPLALTSQSLEPTCVDSGRVTEGLGTLSPQALATITSARASSTRHTYALKWNLFVTWYSSHQEDPWKCPISHDPVDGKSLGKHDLITRFLRGTMRLNLPCPQQVPSWDLAVVLSTLQRAPFEPLLSVELKFLSLKTVLLMALASVKGARDLQVFSVDKACLEFGPVNSHVILRPSAWIRAQRSQHSF